MATAITAVPTSLASSAAKLSKRPGDVVAEHGKRWLVLIGADSDSDEIVEFFREMMPDVEHDEDLNRRPRRRVVTQLRPPVLQNYTGCSDASNEGTV